VRPAAADDLPAVNAIYNSFVVDRHTSFDIEPLTLQERRAWFDRHSAAGPHTILVATADGAAIGFAASSRFRPKPAYDTSVETTVVVTELAWGHGVGRLLLTALVARLHTQDLHRAYALIALPNDPSVALHVSLGYRRVGTLDEVGYKRDRYWSVALMELDLDDSR